MASMWPAVHILMAMRSRTGRHARKRFDHGDGNCRPQMRAWRSTSLNDGCASPKWPYHMERRRLPRFSSASIFARELLLWNL